MKYLKLFLFVFIFIGLLSYINAEQKHSFGTYKQNECINLIQTCSNCTYINITSIIAPNATKIISNAEMTKDGTIFNRTFCLTDLSGKYIVNGVGDLDGSAEVWNYDFEITPSGFTNNVGKSISYGLIFIFSLILLVVLLFFGIGIPSGNKSDEMTGYILAVSNLKYLKYTLLAFAYLVGVFITYFIWMLSYSYLDMDFLSNIMKFIFYFLTISIFPLFVLYCYIVIANLVRDSKINEMLSRGFKVR